MDRARQIEQCADVIVQILLRCRHKGAIEDTGEALGTLCKRLFASQEDQIRSIPKTILTSFLTRLELSESGSSVTRRSAGLTFIVDKIVSSEPIKSEVISHFKYSTNQRPFINDLNMNLLMSLLIFLFL